LIHTYQIRNSSTVHVYNVVIVWQRGVILEQKHTQRVLSEESGYWIAEVPNSYALFSTPSFPPLAVLANGTSVTVSAISLEEGFDKASKSHSMLLIAYWNR
jgi:hypothetical protein